VEYAATLGTVGDITLADLRKYRLIRKGGVEQASSIHVRFTQGEQTFRAFYRCDGQPVPRSALTPFKGSNTLSPFITLATRS
jgi:HK97 family phage major capsid protein